MHQDPESEKVPLKSIHHGSSGGDTPLLDLNLTSGTPIINQPTPVIQKLIEWIYQQLDTSNVEKSVVAVNELKNLLHICQEELDSRSLAQTKAGVGACPSSSQAKYRKSSEMSEDVGLNSATTDFGSPEETTNAAFSDELSSMRLVMSTRSKDGDRRMQNECNISATKSCVPSIPRPSVRNPKKERQLSSNRKQDFRFSGMPSSRISKRRAFAYCPSMNSESDKVQRIVLSDDEDGESLHTLQDADTNDYRNYKIYYPSRDDPECVELAYGDIKSLDPKSCLSSPIMNFYIQYIRRSPSSIAMQKEECFVFNTYFYSKLEEAINCEGDKDAAFLKMRRWWKGVYLFQKPYVFLPIHGQMHWSLVIICIPAKEDESGPILLHLDSLKVHASAHILQVVSKFLLQEWNYIKKNCCIQDLPFSQNVWDALPWRIEKGTIMVPRQTNEYDCGLFVLYCMQRFIEEAPKRMKKEDLSRFGKKWFLPEEASSLRDKVRDALVNEFEKNMLSDSGVNVAGDS